MAVIGKNIEKASELILGGKLVAIPTETVYGLAANALNRDAVLDIFEVKQRPQFNPLISHIYSIDQLDDYADEIPKIAYDIAEEFSPGPITFLLKKKEILPYLVTSGNEVAAFRIPAHDLTQELLRAVKVPLAAPSANPFGFISPTCAEHVNDQLGEKIPYILNGGECTVGVESTIISFEEDLILIHRIGGVTLESLTKFGKIELRTTEKPLAPGQLKSHYAPETKSIFSSRDELLPLSGLDNTAALTFSKPLPIMPISKQKQLSPKEDLHEAARNLFMYLRYLDSLNCDLILLEEVPNHGLGRAINDRLNRAASE